MHRRLFQLGAAFLFALIAPAFSSADVLYRNTAALDDNSVFVGSFVDFGVHKTNVAVLDDGTLGAANASYSLTSVNVGVYNQGNDIASVDLRVQFYDTATYRPFSDTTPTASGPIGSQFRFTLSVLPGADVTGPLALTGVTLPDNTYAIVTRLVTVGTTTDDQHFNFLFKDVPVNVGSSDPLFGADFRDANGTIAKNESFLWPDDGNQFLQIDGTVAPEPGAIGALLTIGMLLAGRRRAR